MALQISFNLIMIFVFDLGFLDYQYMTFYSWKFSANFIKMHECYLLSAKFYLYVIMAILIIMCLHLCVMQLAILMFSLLNFGMDKYKVD